MSANRWLDRTQPQTLYSATLLLYINAGFTAFFDGLFGGVVLVIVAGSVAAGFGIANEKKWGYGLGIAMAVLPLILIFAGNPLGLTLISIMFQIAVLALLLHRQSREYQRIWFK